MGGGGWRRVSGAWTIFLGVAGRGVGGKVGSEGVGREDVAVLPQMARNGIIWEHNRAKEL